MRLTPTSWRRHPAAKRQDQISSELARHDYETNVEADAIVKSIERLTKEIHQRVVVERAAGPPGSGMMTP